MDNNLLTAFLRNCADQIDKGLANPELNISAIDFFCKARLNITNIPEDELYKYITMGWYVYQNLPSQTDLNK